MTLVAIRSHVASIGVDQVRVVAAALEKQANGEFAASQPNGWGISASVRAEHDATPRPDYVMGLFEHPDQPNALGYHDRTIHGVPYMKVFPLLDPGQPWSVTASHELLETLADPEGSICAQAPDGKFWAVEVCDPVEADSYKIGSVPVSNFVLPCYFQPTKRPTGYDFMRLCRAPFEVRTGGYSQVWNDSVGWTQIAPDPTRVSSYRRTMLSHGRFAARRARFLPGAR